MNYFAPEELVCKCGCGLNRFDPAMLTILNTARELAGHPLVLTSACRCVAHNAAVGGARRSAHLVGPDNLCHAADIKCISDITRGHLLEIFAHLGIRRFEASPWHLHVDNSTHYLPSPILAAICAVKK